MSEMMNINLECWRDCKYSSSCETCLYCNGYYGPCFGEPACSTCHAFLFPADPAESSVRKRDDDDSGNEEPVERSGEDEAIEWNSPSDRMARPPLLSLTDQLALLTVARADSRLQIDLGLLPPEVLLSVFSHLDDFSLWSAGKVCKRWSQLLQAETTNEKWQEFLSHRWPLFKKYFELRDTRGGWEIYSQLVESAPCKICLYQMSILNPVHHDPLFPFRRTRLRGELKCFRVDPPEGIEAKPLDKELIHWQATITGPAGSPYQGGLFFLYLRVPMQYPMKPPVVKFLTKIFHPNVSRHGDIGLDMLSHNWSSGLTIPKVLVSIQSLLTDPYCKVCMEREIGELYVSHAEEFKLIAAQWTWRYAMLDILPSPP